MSTTETVTYWYAAVMTVLGNVLASAALIACVDVAGAAWWPYAPVVGVCNLAGYLVVVGAARSRPSRLVSGMAGARVVARRVVASLAVRLAARRRPWKREPMRLGEHFALTALVTVGWVFPYLMAAL